MKHISEFLKFDWDAFADGKRFVVTGCSELQDYDTKKHLGTKVECVIYEDNTHYKQKDGEQTTNRFEKLTFKIMKDVNVPLNTTVVPVNASASVYGEYRNMLSIKADDIKIVQTQQQAQQQPQMKAPLRKE